MRKNYFFIFVLATFLFLVGCEKNNEKSTAGSGGTNLGAVCSGGVSTLTDIDNNTYNVVHIGTHCWMKENLKTTKFKNGQSINGTLNANSGRLYDWYTVADPQGLCPTGWHVPTNVEFIDLVTAVDVNTNPTLNVYNSFIAGGYLKSTTGWASPNSGANDSSGFSALPDGAYYTAGGGGLYGQGKYAYFWTADDCIGASPWSWMLYYDNSSIASCNYLHGKSGKISVRCVMD